MKKILFFLLITVYNCGFSQKVTETIFSNKLNEDREIVVSLPPSYEENKDQKYPVLVILDGDFLNYPFEGNLNYGYYWDDLPKMIVISLTHNQRETDCSYNVETGLPDENSSKYFEFIGMEMLPYIEKKYRIGPFRMVAGLDTTAGFLNFYLYKDVPVFDAYISISPDLPTDMEEHIPERLATIQKPIFYYLSTAGGDLKNMRERVLKMDEEIKALNNPNLNYKFENYTDASHFSLALHSIPGALYQLFSVYQPISINEFQEKIVTLPYGYSDYLINKYDTLKNTFGIETKVRLSDFKAIEAAIMINKDYNDFDKLAILADKDYPKTMLSYYFMAKLFEMKGNLKRALKEYQNGSQMEEISDLTKNMMLDKVDELIIAIKKEKEKPEEVYEEEIIDETPVEVPAETPTEEIKPE